MLSIHSMLGLPRLPFPPIIPNIPLFIYIYILLYQNIGLRLELVLYKCSIILHQICPSLSVCLSTYVCRIACLPVSVCFALSLLFIYTCNAAHSRKDTRKKR